MEREQIEQTFRKELSLFNPQDTRIKNFTVQLLMNLPDYFTEQKENGTENDVLRKTRNSIHIADTLFQREHYMLIFSPETRDIILSALLLRDGFIYGYGYTRDVKPDHGIEMAYYIRNEYWEQLLPSDIREQIAGAVETHDYNFGDENKNYPFPVRQPKNTVEQFVNDCNALSGIFYPVIKNEAVPVHEDDGSSGDLSFTKALSIANQMIKGKTWDGTTMTNWEGTYVYLDNVKTIVPRELRSAFQTLGQTIKAQQQSPFFDDSCELYEYDYFRRVYPEWDNQVYGEPGGFFVFTSSDPDKKRMDISDGQAELLGIKVEASAAGHDIK